MICSHRLNRMPSIFFVLIGGATWASASEMQASPPAPKTLSFEERGDIFGVRKMYREAIEAYKQVTPPTAVILNKIGIAYQQQNDMAYARKYYERSVKLEPQYD